MGRRNTEQHVPRLNKVLAYTIVAYLFIMGYVYFRQFFSFITGIEPAFAIIPYLIVSAFIPKLVKKIEPHI